MSFTKNAERKPQVKITAGSSCEGLKRSSTISAFHSKKPTRCRFPTISIMEKSNTRVEKLMNFKESPGARMRKPNIATAPTMAAPGRSIFNPGNFPNAKTR